MFNRDWIPYKQVWDDYSEPRCGPFISYQLSIDIIRSVDISQEDDGIFFPVLGARIRRGDISPKSVELLEGAFGRSFVYV